MDTTTPHAAETPSPNRDVEIIAAALAEFVTILLDGAFYTEGEHAHLDVIALCYVMPLSVTADWPGWRSMWSAWVADGRAPSSVSAREPDGLTVRFLGRLGYRFTSYGLTWWEGDLRSSAEHVAKVIADGLDDELLIFLYGDDYGRGYTVRDCERMDVARRLAAIAGSEQGHRLLDHLERALDKLDAEDTASSLRWPKLFEVFRRPPSRHAKR